MTNLMGRNDAAEMDEVNLEKVKVGKSLSRYAPLVFIINRRRLIY